MKEEKFVRKILQPLCKAIDEEIALVAAPLCVNLNNRLTIYIVYKAGYVDTIKARCDSWLNLTTDVIDFIKTSMDAREAF